MKAVITVVGCDKIGIIASITAVLAKTQVNILDISQTIMQNIFTMVMLVDLSKLNCDFAHLGELLQEVGKELGVDIRLQREEIFTSMHRI
ncbi:MAG: ACT domain-containing protein [Firmicutes bacterium]|nr:ACT domain-containing protein [Bacillota bacterium]NLU52557.1 ACT domain-containing protein [Clostridiaceae bacterium]